MTMSNIVSVAIFLTGTMLTVMFSLFRKTIFEKLDTIGAKLDGLEKEVLLKYARKEEVKECFVEERDARKEMWIEINNLKEKVAGIAASGRLNAES